MLKHINKILKIVGFNLIHAKKPKRAGYRVHVPIEDAKTDARAYGYDKHENAYQTEANKIEDARCIPSPTCCVDEYNAKTDARPVVIGDGHTHYVGDDCKPAHVDASPTQDNNITGPTS